MRDEWARTNAIQSTIANVHDHKLGPEDFSPFKQIDQRGEGLQKFRAMAKALADAGKIRTIKKD